MQKSNIKYQNNNVKSKIFKNFKFWFVVLIFGL